jgi:hypothetical protein
MLRRRRPFEQWPLRDVARSFVGCLTSNPDNRYVRAAYILRFDIDRLPKDFPDVVRQRMEEAGVPFTDFPPFALFLLDFDDADRVDVFMDFNNSILVRKIEHHATADDARDAAVAWVTEGGREAGGWLDFDYTPGLYQGAVLEAITGREIEPAEWYFMWALPAESNPEVVVVRRYPPRVTDEELPPDAPLTTDEVEDGIGDGFTVMPSAVIRRLFANKF